MPDVTEPFGPTVLWHIRAALNDDPPASLRAITCSWDAHKVAIRCIFSKPLTVADQAAMDAIGLAITQALPRQVVDLECMVRSEEQALSDLKLMEWVYTRLG